MGAYVWYNAHVVLTRTAKAYLGEAKRNLLTRRSNRLLPYYVKEIQLLAQRSDVLGNEMPPIIAPKLSLRFQGAALHLCYDWYF